MKYQALETEQKALEINLNDKIYGTFAEIGAGQEVARYFFTVGAAAGTIAKTMSAYDKVYSDKIYGAEAKGRYVCESRLYKMLDHEYELMESRLANERPDTNFFVFADTIAALNYSRTIKGDGWLGFRFQLSPQGETNDIVLHVKMLDNSTELQAQAVGILGVNLVYGCYHYQDDVEVLLQSLMDNLRGRVEIDMVRITGPDFKDVDNRWVSLMLVKNELSKVAMFGPDGQNIHASEFLYKKHVLVVRGSFRPATLVNQDMLHKSFEQFRNEPEVEARKSFLLTEITMDNMCKGNICDLDEKDFLDRAEVLCAMGQTVVVSNCEQHHRLINYLSDFKVQTVGLVIGVKELLKIINDKYYNDHKKSLLMEFGELFTKKMKMYVYPSMQEGSEEFMTSENLPIPDAIKHLYKHLVVNGKIVDIQNFDPNILHIFSKQVIELIKANDEEWEKMVPEKVKKLIKEKYLFNYPFETMEFKY
ncbi:MAG TPA: TonB-dependent receptor [Phaeodactylibacter sp.]|nr:TonB-dependent receptor [Phaeodactylibacter sp.]